jgi:lysophosphatidylcholine acyltransferase / lyso-PAF acetyltransferase
MRALFWASSFHYITYIGKRATAKEAPIICVGPHTSFMDSLCVIVMGPSAVVAKKEAAELPLIGSTNICYLKFVFFLLLN